MKITSGDYKCVVESQVVIIAAGANQKSSEARLDLTNRNVKVLLSILEP